MAALIELDHVRREFDRGNIVGVDDVSLTIERGEKVAIIGPSGSGKSTLLNLMCGLDLPTSGEVRFDGRRVRSAREWTAIRARRMGFVFQNFCLLPTLDAAENVEVAMFGIVPTARQRRERALDLLARFGLAGRSHLEPPLLSGGERQRVAIARAIANNPEVVVADEPTGNLDRKAAQSTMELLVGLQQSSGTALVIVTHDPSVAAVCERQVEIVDGRIVHVEHRTARPPAMMAGVGETAA
ncbi:MAG TPA: ABC transporter ATP-binding protein [Bauldia sp.]|nr:ABC transporter ATP-binding protein [Bauldia sp.]